MILSLILPSPLPTPVEANLYLGGEGYIIRVKVSYGHPHIPQYSHLFGNKVHPINNTPCKFLSL